MTDTPATLPTPAATAAKAIIGNIVRHALTAAGSILVTRGVIDQGTVDGYMGTAVEIVAGGLMVGGAQGWGIFRAWLAHTRFAAAITALKAAETVNQGPGAT